MIIRDVINNQFFGGTELMFNGLEKYVSHDLLKEFAIGRDLPQLMNDKTERKKIYWTHEVSPCLSNDPMLFHGLKMALNTKHFNKVVFVSNWQLNQHLYNFKAGVNVWPDSKVLLNAIEPIEKHEKPKDRINLIYISNPERGLDILYETFLRIAPKHPDIHLSVFCDEELFKYVNGYSRFQDLFAKLREHDQISYSPKVSNEKIREELKKAHILAYPSTYGETSCISLMECMSAEVLCVHPNQAALYETAAGLTNMYHYDFEPQKHVDRFEKELEKAIRQYKNGKTEHLKQVKQYADYAFNWDKRAVEWTEFLTEVLDDRIQISPRRSSL
jgi:glycosyltransferase involved in cell wall biosynthesis